MKNKKIIITNNQALINFIAETNSSDYTVADTGNISFLMKKPNNLETIFIEEETLAENPQIFSYFDSINSSSKVIIDNAVNIIQKVLKRKKHYNIDKIPFKIERIIFDFLHDCMIKDNYHGYLYLKQALFILYIDPTAAFNIKKCIYLPIQAKIDTTEETVERCIRYAIKCGYDQSKKYNCDNLFKKFNSCPSNKIFIEAALQYIGSHYSEFNKAL